MTDMTIEYLRSMLHYDPETGKFHWAVHRGPNAKKGWEAGTTSTTLGYRYINIGGKRRAAHRLAWFYMYGLWPNGDIDHKNRDRTDNRISNLREATRSQNIANIGLSKKNRSGCRGVWFDPRWNKWRAILKKNGREINLGRHTRKSDAVTARAVAEKRLNGEFSSIGYADDEIILIDVQDDRLTGCERMILEHIGRKIYQAAA